MKKESKFRLEKFQVAKLKNLKNISGGIVTNANNATTIGGNDNTVFTTTDLTIVGKDGSNGICVV